MKPARRRAFGLALPAALSLLLGIGALGALMLRTAALQMLQAAAQGSGLRAAQAAQNALRQAESGLLGPDTAAGPAGRPAECDALAAARSPRAFCPRPGDTALTHGACVAPLGPSSTAGLFRITAWACDGASARGAVVQSVYAVQRPEEGPPRGRRVHWRALF